MPIDHKIINASSKLNEYRSNSINGRVSYATKQTHPLNGTKFDGKGFCFIVVGNKKHDILILTVTMRKYILQS